MINMTHNWSPDCVSPFWKNWLHWPYHILSTYYGSVPEERLCLWLTTWRKVCVAVKSWAILEHDQCDALWEIKCPTDHNDPCLVLEHLQNFELSLFSWLLMINDAVIRTTLALYLPVLRFVASTCSQVASQRSRLSAKCQCGELHERVTPAWDESLWRRSHDSIPRRLSGYR